MVRPMIVAFGVLLTVARPARAAEVSPVQKVIELLGDLKSKVEKDLAAETAAMEEYLSYCDFEAKDTEFAIRTGEREIEDVEAVILETSAKVQQYEAEIGSISSEIAAKEAELAEAVSERDAERKNFLATEKDLLGTADEMSRAIMTIKKDGSFIQMPNPTMKAIATALGDMVNAEWLDLGSRKRLAKFLQQNSAGKAEDSEGLSLKQTEDALQPQAKTSNYDSHSGGILDTVQDMADKAQEGLSECRKKEMKAAHAYDMLKMNFEDSINLLKTKLSDATQAKATTAEAGGKAKGEKAGMTKSLAADKEYLTSLNTECQEKSSEWDGRKESAAGELAAIAKAKEILASGVKAAMIQEGSTIRHPYGESATKTQKRKKLSNILRDLGKQFHSYAMMELASRAKADPFAKIKGLIQDMVDKLMNEANEEASHKAFCDEELTKSGKSREEKEFKMDDFQGRMDSASSGISVLTEQVKTLQSEIADIDVAQREAAKVRQEEKANFITSVTDAKASAEAVAQAIQVLKDYYEGASLVQVKAKKRAATWVAAKQPDFGSDRSDSGGSIVSVLETAEADFTKMVAEAETQENQSVEAYRKLYEEDELAKTAKTAAVRGKTSEIKSLEVNLNHYKDDHATVMKEFDAVMAYIDKLRPECESKVMSYEERKARREAEIEGLKEALAVLEGEAIVFAETKRSLRRVIRL